MTCRIAPTTWAASAAGLTLALMAGTRAVTAVSAVWEMAQSRCRVSIARRASVSEVLAWRIGRYLAVHAEARREQANGCAPADWVLPWLPTPLAAPDTSEGMARYLGDAHGLIAARTDELGKAAVRERPAWTVPLGLPPEDTATEAQWLRHVAIIAAYRDQHKVTSDDPRQVLGPYVEAGQEGHKAYWLAAEAVLSARSLAGLDASPNTGAPDGQAHAQLAADIYRTLPDDERMAVSTEMRARLGPLWFGNRAEPDQDATTQPAHSATLVATLVKRGYLTSTQPVADFVEEPIEVGLVKQGSAHNTRRMPNPAPNPQRVLRPEVRLRPDPITTRPSEQRPR
jgi:hypothetical protein